MRAGSWAAVAALACWMATPATAQEATAPAAGASFGWQVAAVDLGVVALAATGGALAARSSGFAVLPALAGVGYFAGGPLVHAAHGDGDGAWTSLGWRVIAPVTLGGAAAGVAALATTDGRSDICSSRRACAALFWGAAGFGAGMIAAMVHDWATAREPAAAAAARGTGVATPHRAVSWIPIVSASPEAAAVGLAARW